MLANALKRERERERFVVHGEEKEKRQGENKGWRRFKKAWTEVFDNNRRRVARY